MLIYLFYILDLLLIYIYLEKYIKAQFMQRAVLLMFISRLFFN